MDHPDAPPDPDLARLMAGVRHIAVVGWSPKPARASHYVAAFLAARGYRVTPVNPAHAGRVVDGVAAVSRLSDIPAPVDMVDIFRARPHIPGLVEEAFAMTPRPGLIWMQLGLRHTEAAARARSAGLQVVQNRCPKIEIPRLLPPGWRRDCAAAD